MYNAIFFSCGAAVAFHFPLYRLFLFSLKEKIVKSGESLLSLAFSFFVFSVLTHKPVFLALGLGWLIMTLIDMGLTRFFHTENDGFSLKTRSMKTILHLASAIYVFVVYVDRRDDKHMIWFFLLINTIIMFLLYYVSTVTFFMSRFFYFTRIIIWLSMVYLVCLLSI